MQCSCFLRTAHPMHRVGTQFWTAAPRACLGTLYGIPYPEATITPHPTPPQPRPPIVISSEFVWAAGYNNGMGRSLVLIRWWSPQPAVG